MADALLFRKGLLANLPSTKTAGTIYVTTDERAMYIDVDGTNRIRLGDFIEVATTDDLKNYKPFSTTALYYITSTDALMKYKGNIDGQDTFVTINSTAAVSAQIAEVRTAVEKNASDIADLQSDLADAVNANSATQAEVDALEGVVASNKSAIEKTVSDLDAAYKAEDERLAGLISGNADDIADLADTKADKTALKSVEDAYKAADVTINNNITGVSNRVTALETTVNAATTGLKDRMTAAESAIGTINGTISDMQEAHNTLAGRVTQNETDISTLQGKVNTNTTNITNLGTDLTNLTKRVSANETDIDSLQSTVGNHTNDISDLQDEVAKKADKTALTAVENAYKAADTTLTNNLNAAVGRISANEGAITALQTKDTELAGLISDNADDIAGLADTKADKTALAEVESAYKAADVTINNSITGVSNRVTALETTVDTATTGLKDRMTAVEKKAADNAEDIADLASEVSSKYVLKTTYDSKMSALDTQDQTHTQNIAALVTKTDTTNSDLARLTTRVTTAEGAISTNADAIADNAEAIAANAEAIETLEAKDVELKNYIDGQFAAADAMKFMGGIASLDAAKKLTGVEAGHTYVLTARDDVAGYALGDLLIAKVDGDATQWTHVASGYVQEHESELSGAGNAIKLTSYTGANLGTIAVATDASSVTASVANNTLTIGMEWGSF